MKKQRTSRRYYKVGEKVWIKDKKVSGEVQELTVLPSENTYKATLSYTENGEKKVGVFDLWEIDKHKVEMYKAKRKAETQPTILFAKIRPSAIIPSKDEENAGYDIYANFEDESITILPHTVKLIPTGIASSVTSDWVLEVRERGSTGSKNMAKRAGVIDSGYRGEIFIAIANDNDTPLVIAKNPEQYENHSDAIVYPYNKAIAQLLLLPVPKAKVKEISYEELSKIPSKRGTGKVGSSGK